MRFPYAPSGPGLGAVAILGLALLPTGCDTRPRVGATVPVSGVVKLGDAPLHGGQVTFIPAPGNQSPFQPIGTITADGKYTLLTANAVESKAGAPAGKYKVTIVPIALMGTDANVQAPPPPGSAVAWPLLTPAMSSPIDPKYGNPATSGLSVEVVAGGGPYDFILR